MTIDPDDALVVVDVQNDFLPGGSLAVAQGERVIAPINALMPRFPVVYATRDWHPADHLSFKRNGGVWPDHCVQGTPGAEFDARIAREHIDKVISTGFEPQLEGYSGFESTELETDLRQRGVRRVFMCGIATDYCVKETALDAKRAGFETVVITDAIAAVNAAPGDDERALEELRRAGIELIESRQIIPTTPAHA